MPAWIILAVWLPILGAAALIAAAGWSAWELRRDMRRW